MSEDGKLLLMEVNRIFMTLDYKLGSVFDVDDFYKTVIKKINVTKDLNQAEILIQALIKFIDHFDKFALEIRSNESREFFDSLRLKPFKVELVNKNIARQYFHIANGLTNDYRRFMILDVAYGKDYVDVIRDGCKYSLLDYYAIIDINKPNSMDIYDKNDNLIMSLIKKHNKVILKDKPIADILLFDKGSQINIYTSESLQSVNKGHDNIAKKEPAASIECLMLTNKNGLGICKCKCYRPDFPKELVILIAIAKTLFNKK